MCGDMVVSGEPLRIVQEAVNEVREETGRDPLESIAIKSNLRDDLGLDSLDLAVLTVKLEASTGVDVFSDGLVQTVGEIVSRIDG